MRWPSARLGLVLLLAMPMLAPATEVASGPLPTGDGTRNGREIYQRFRDGLADPACQADASMRWKAHFAHAPGQLAAREGDMLPLFGYVVEALREAHLPTEYALIPFVESGYRPGARSPQGPAGLWQMIAITARNHQVPMRPGYDGRLSPVDSTTAAVRYLKTLHGMFAGDWRLAVMAYNAGEYRVLAALKRAGQTARAARPEALTGLSPITHAYVRKLHALSCLMEQAEDREAWLRALDRTVPVLQAVEVTPDVADLDTWAARHGQDAAMLRRLNPVFANGRFPRGGSAPVRLLAAAAGAGATSASAALPGTDPPAADAALATTTAEAKSDPTPPITGSQAGRTPVRRHTVVRGDTASRIALRYGIRVADLLARNGLHARSVLRPGAVLLVDPAGDDNAPTAAGTR